MIKWADSHTDKSMTKFIDICVRMIVFSYFYHSYQILSTIISNETFLRTKKY